VGWWRGESEGGGGEPWCIRGVGRSGVVDVPTNPCRTFHPDPRTAITRWRVGGGERSPPRRSRLTAQLPPRGPAPALSAYSAAFSTQDLTLFDPPSSLAANLPGGRPLLPSPVPPAVSRSFFPSDDPFAAEVQPSAVLEACNTF